MNFCLTSENPYIQQGIHDCLLPIIFPLAQQNCYNCLPSAWKGAIATLPVFNVIVESYRENPKAVTMHFDIKIIGAKKIEQLNVLNQTLPLCKKIKTLIFSHFCKDPEFFSWTEGVGFDSVHKV